MKSTRSNQKGIFDPVDGITDSLSVSSFSEVEWKEDLFVPDDDVIHTDGMLKMHTSLTRRKFFGFLLFFLVSFTIVGGRLFSLQVLADDTYLARAEGNRQRTIPIKSERGIIYDTNGIQLTKNVPKFSLALIPQDLPRTTGERNALVEKLADIIEEDPSTIRSIIEQYGAYSYESITIKDNLDYETALSIQIAAAELPGITIERGSKRLYQSGEVAETGEPLPVMTLSHVLGYEGKLNQTELETYYPRGYYPSDFIGKTGIEKTYESELRGTYGSRVIEVDARGKEQITLSETAPYPGKHLYLTIDAKLQGSIEAVVKKFLTEFDKKNASIVAMDPNTGAIKALVSWPSFDNNDFSGGIDAATYQSYLEDDARPLFNRAISGAFPSGSTVKPAIAAAALQEGIINKNTTFRSSGGISVGQWFFPDWQAGGHGITDVRRSIAWSVNTFYYYIGGGFEEFVGLGVEVITEYLKKFGMAEVLGIDIPGEVPGFLPSKEWKEDVKGERWYVGDTYNVSIGQGDLLITPLQLAAQTSVIANGGKLHQPYLVEKIVDPVSGDTAKTEPRIIRSNFIDSWHLDTVKAGMGDCVEYGSCRRLSLLPFSSGAKTGTAQWSSIKDDHAWFSSFAPFENPEIVIVIMVEEGEGGSTIGSPMAFDIYNWWWKYRNDPTTPILAYTEEL